MTSLPPEDARQDKEDASTPVTEQEIQDLIGEGKDRNWKRPTNKERKEDMKQKDLELTLLERDARGKIASGEMTIAEAQRYMTEFSMNSFKEAMRKLMAYRELIQRDLDGEMDSNEREKLTDMLKQGDAYIKEMKEELKEWRREEGM